LHLDAKREVKAMMLRRLVALLAAAAASACHYTVELPPPGTIDIRLVQAPPPAPTLTIEAPPDATYQGYRIQRTHDCWRARATPSTKLR
jgi:hypothetical protein